MNREIKFRAWIIKNKKWIDFTGEDGYRWYLDFELKQAFCMERNWQIVKEVPFSKLEIMQYTGLKDKNGIEIYEGDIIKEIRTSPHDFEPRSYQVKWADNGWALVIEPYHSRHFRDAFQMEVIGNIYGNPELLKGR